MNKKDKNQLANKIEKAIWNVIKSESTPNTFDWEVTFETYDNEELTLNNESITKYVDD